MNDLGHGRGPEEVGEIDSDLQHRLTQQTIMRSLRPVDLSGKATVRPSRQDTPDVSEGETVIQAAKKPGDISEKVTVAPSRGGKSDLSVSDAQTLDTLTGKGEIQDEGWDPWRVALPRRMGNWQELTLLPLPDDPDGVIGAGGQATIYSYVQRELGRGVAVKALRPEGRSYEAIEDLVREACVTARLEHPNIVPVHYLHLPEHDQDAPYWVMKRIHGKALTAHLPGEEDPWPIDKLLDVFRRILDAVAFAHSRGIVHRDLKPDNVLVGAFGEVQVTDWGLAVAINEEGARGAKPVVEADAAATKGEAPDGASRSSTSQKLSEDIAKLNEEVRSGSIGALLKTSSGGRAGTPAYMAPEQLEWTADDIDERTDVFLLGGILYAVITGSPPHGLSGFTNAEEMFDAIRRCSTLVPPDKRREAKGCGGRPEGLSPIAVEGLSAITMKALSREAENRHASVEVLVRALDKWESRSASAELTAEAQSRLDETESARRPSARGYAEVIALADASLAKWQANEEAQRIRDQASTALTTIQRRSSRRFWVAAAAIALMFLVGSIGYQRTRFQRNRAEQNAAAEAEQRRIAVKRQQEADAAREEANTERDSALREMYCANIALAQQKIRDADIRNAERLLDACPEQVRSWEWGYLNRLCHLELLSLKGHGGPVFSVAFSPDGQRIASGSNDKTIKVWDSLSGREVAALKGHDSAVSSLAFSQDGQRIASGSWDSTVKVWDVETGREVVTFRRHAGSVISVAFSPNGGRIASTDVYCRVKVWDAETGREVTTQQGKIRDVSHVEVNSSVAFSPDGQHLASGHRRGKTVKVWDVEGVREVLTFSGHDSFIWSVAFSPDGRRIASGGGNGIVKVWDAVSGHDIVTLKGHASGVSSVAFSPDGQHIGSGSSDKTVKVWHAASGREIVTLKGHDSGVSSVAFSPDSQRIVSGGWDRTVKVWDAASGRAVAALRGHRDPVHSVAFSPDGQRIASGGWDGSVKVWDVTSRRELVTLRGNGPLLSTVAFSYDGQRIAANGMGRTVKVWDAADGRELLTLRGHGRGRNSVAFSPDGQRIASCGRDMVVRVWNAADGRELITLKGHDSGVPCVAFSPDGQCIVSGSSDRTVKVWHATGGREILTLKGHQSEICSVAFSPDGQRIVSGSSDRTVKVWHATGGREILTLRGHGSEVLSVVFSPDGQRIVSGSADKTMRLWDAATGRELLTLTGHGSGVASVAFSPDGQRIACASEEKIVKIWDATPVLDFNRLMTGVANGEAQTMHRLALFHERRCNDAEARELHMKVATDTPQQEWAGKSRWRLENMPWLKP